MAAVWPAVQPEPERSGIWRSPAREAKVKVDFACVSPQTLGFLAQVTAGEGQEKWPVRAGRMARVMFPKRQISVQETGFHGRHFIGPQSLFSEKLVDRSGVSRGQEHPFG